MEAVSRTFHRLSSYTLERPWIVPADDPRVRQDFIPLLDEVKPTGTKVYPARLVRVELPPPRAQLPPAVSLLGSPYPVVTDANPDLHDVATVLRLAGGYRARGLARARFRAASSAGNRHPYELYLSARGLDGLPDGIWYYEPCADGGPDRLVRIGPQASGDTSAVIVTGLPWRSCWRYAERGYRMTAWDCGTVACHLLLAAAACGIPARLIVGFDDADLARLVGARTEEEFAMCVVSLGRGEPAIVGDREADLALPDPTHETFPLVDQVHEAARLAGHRDLATWRRRRSLPETCDPLSPPDNPARPSFDVVVARRASARRFDPAASIPAGFATWLLNVAAQPVPWDAGRVHEIHAVAQHVDSLDPGVYRWADGRGDRTRDIDREQTYAACLSQPLGRDAALLVLIAPWPGPGVSPDARTYRASLIGAGLVIGRVTLAATSLGLRCCGLTFVDSELPKTFGPDHATALIAVGATR